MANYTTSQKDAPYQHIKSAPLDKRHPTDELGRAALKGKQTKTLEGKYWAELMDNHGDALFEIHRPLVIALVRARVIATTAWLSWQAKNNKSDYMLLQQSQTQILTLYTKLGLLPSQGVVNTASNKQVLKDKDEDYGDLTA